MTTFTAETIERADFSSILKALEEKRKAERLLEAQSKALGVAEKDLRSVLNAQERAFQANAAAMTVAGDSTASLNGAMGNLRSQLFDIGTQLSSGTSPFLIMSQQGPQVAEVFLNNATMASRFAAVLPVIGTAAAGAAAVGAPLLAWYTELGDQNERLAALTDETAVAMGRLSDAATKIAEAEKELAQREGTLAGTVSEEAKLEIEAQAKAAETYGDAIGALRQEIGALKDAAADLEAQRDSFMNIFDLTQIFGGKDVNDRIKDINKSIADREQKIAELGEESDRFVKRTVAVDKAEDAAEKKAKKRAKAVKEEKDRTIELVQALQALEDIQAPAAGRMDQDAREKAQRRQLLLIEDRVQAAKRAAFETIKDEEALQEALTEIARMGAEERAKVDMIGAETAEEAEQRRYRAAQKRADAVLALEKLQQDRMLAWGDAAAKVVQSVETVIEAVVDDRSEYLQDAQDAYDEALESGDAATIRSAEKRLDAEKESAMRAWEIQQAAAFATAVAMAAQGIAVAGAAYPPPANVPAMIAAGAIGAANVAAVIASPAPEFDDTPGVMRADPGGARAGASFKAGDYMAAAQNPADLIRQVLEPLMGSKQRRDYAAPASVRSTIYIGAKQANAIEAQANLNRRGAASGTRPLGRRVASSGGPG